MPASRPAKGAPAGRHPIRLLVVLGLINFINFAARMVIVPLFPLLRDEFSLTDAQLGSLQTALQVVLALATVPFALLADRASRRAIITIGLIVSSVATILSGLAGTFLTLLVARALVGIGEAAYAPAAQSMISGDFPQQLRGRALAVFAAAMLVGGGAGQALGGILGDTSAWRWAFAIVGIPGIVLALAALRLDDPLRGPKTEVVPMTHLLRVPAYLALIASGVLVTFASVSFITWGPDYMVRFKDFSMRQAGVLLGGVGLVSLVGGALVGGAVADYLQRRMAYGRVIAVAVGFLCAGPFLIWGLATDSREALLAAFSLAGFFMSWYHGPVTAIIHDMMPPRAYATSVGLYMFVTQLAGAFGPALVGDVSDIFDLQLGLQLAVGVMTAGAMCFLLVIFFIRRHGLQHPALSSYRQAGDM
ncbi:MAG TPA: MFS transporter [Candidatus Acidoferrales bacterium]|nr:MFS transporter [Candidatus Acidoferrales bacterium]